MSISRNSFGLLGDLAAAITLTITTAIAATVICLPIALLSVAQSPATDAAHATATTQNRTNEAVSNRFQERAAGEGFFAVVAVQPPLRYETVSMTYTTVDGSPVTAGGFSFEQTGNGLRVAIDEATPAGEYKVVIDTLAPSEIDHDLAFYVTVTEGMN